MGSVFSYFCSPFTRHVGGSPPSFPRPTLSGVLDELRKTQTSLEAHLTHKRRRIVDVDVEMVTIGLRMKNSDNRLSVVDAHLFKRLYRKKQILVNTHGQFCGVLSNLDHQIELLQNIPPTQSSRKSLSAGARLHAAENIEQANNSVELKFEEILASVRANVDNLGDISAIKKQHQSITTEIDKLKENDLEKRLKDLMDDSRFMGQFNPEDLQRERLNIVKNAPNVPEEKPTQKLASSVGDAEKALGL